MRKSWALSVIAILLASTSWAVPITFIHTGDGEGTLDGVAFDSAFTITAIADTDDRESYSSGFFTDHISATIAIESLGTFTFLVPTRTFVNQNSSIVGFSRGGISGADLFSGPSDPVFAAYDLLTSIGPIFGDGFLQQWTLTPVDTTGGVLVFDGQSVENAIFQAIAGPGQVPEPGTLALLALGLLALRRARR